ncbi:DegV family protein [Selenihalanaerobacter shriftii]|uniref:EDD domain protein, DegV family n=1 Tax=Selenihalanaerobacter shriftii TaxID=142842 RepID=A0A1T4JJF8_9FIRM|nr:DegV family protein [Selenihalanaerobacter shriftii]SJZ30281.1 EDD domain protein, DegV family [Selenihalanaerobacter shriftii]
MTSIKVVTDSTVGLSLDGLDELEVDMVPLTVNFANQFFADKVDISSEQFFKKLKEVQELPTTSQPAMGKFKEKYLELADDYDTIISIHLSSKLSGTYRSAKLAADRVQEEKDIDIRVIDSKSASLGIGFLVLYAIEAIKQGLVIEEIVTGIERRVEAVTVLFTVDTLEYLEKGGRIGKASAFVGNLLNIKPILKVNETGEVDLYSKVRGKKRLFKKVKRLVKRELDNRNLSIDPKLGLLHGDAKKDLDNLEAELEGLTDWDNIMTSEISPVLGTHIGPGALGIVIL